MCNALYFATFIFILHIPCFHFFLIDHNQKQVLLIKWVVFFFKLKNFFLLFSTFWKSSYPQRISTLINVLKFDVENNNTASTFSNVIDINIENYQYWFDIIRRCDIETLTTTLRQYWKNSWVLANVTKKLHNFVKFIKWKTYIFSRIPLNCCFRKISKRYW